MAIYYKCTNGSVVFIDRENNQQAARQYQRLTDILDPARVYAVNPDLKAKFWVVVVTRSGLPATVAQILKQPIEETEA